MPPWLLQTYLGIKEADGSCDGRHHRGSICALMASLVSKKCLGFSGSAFSLRVNRDWTYRGHYTRAETHEARELSDSQRPSFRTQFATFGPMIVHKQFSPQLLLSTGSKGKEHSESVPRAPGDPRGSHSPGSLALEPDLSRASLGTAFRTGRIHWPGFPPGSCAQRS